MKEELIKCQRELESMKEAYSQMLGLKELYKARLAWHRMSGVVWGKASQTSAGKGLVKE